MTNRQRYEELLSTARRQYGQYARRLPAQGDPTFEDIYKPISGKRGYSERNIQALEKRIERAPARLQKSVYTPTEEEEEVAKIEYDNLIASLYGTGRPKTSKGAKITDEIASLIEDILDKGYKKYKSYKQVMDRIKTWSISYTKEVEALVLWLYNSEYQVSRGNVNKPKWTYKVQKLANMLNVTVTQTLYRAIMTDLND